VTTGNQGFTRQAASRAPSLTSDDANWCGSDAITEDDHAKLEHPNLSRFIYELGDRELIADAIGSWSKPPLSSGPTGERHHREGADEFAREFG